MKKNDYILIGVIAFLVIAFLLAAFLPSKSFEENIPYEKVEAMDNSRLYDEELTNACLVEAYLYSVPKEGNGFAEMTNALHQQKDAFLSALPEDKVLSPNQMVALMLVHSKLGTKAFKERIGNAYNSEALAENVFHLPIDNKGNLKAFWVLYHVYHGAISPLELYDYPIQSYINLPEDALYEDSIPNWLEGFENILAAGDGPTLRNIGFIPMY